MVFTPIDDRAAQMLALRDFQPASGSLFTKHTWWGHSPSDRTAYLCKSNGHMRSFPSYEAAKRATEIHNAKEATA